MSDDSRAEGCRRDYVIEQVEIVPMTAEQYDQAVNAFATLIVGWATSRRGHGWASIDGSFSPAVGTHRPMRRLW